MCLIIGKPKGLPLPDQKLMKGWFDAFPDGVGVAFQQAGRVRIVKGAMSRRQLRKLLSRVKRILAEEGKTDVDVDMLIQFRQAFTGAVVPRFCHPFPVSPAQNDLDSLDVMTDIALAHNGIIWDYSATSFKNNDYHTGRLGNINDAQEFIKDYVFPMGDAIWNPTVQKLIKEHTESKFGLLTKDGLTYIGSFIEDKGYFYSNLAYKKGAYTHIGYSYQEDNKFPLVSYSPSSNKFEGGTACDLCGKYVSALYIIHDEQSLVCCECFICLQGYQPLAEERIY